MKISIVTVAFNEEKNIALTIESVLCQTSVQYEYIVCDGKSADKTAEIAESYRPKFEEKGIDYRVYSEKDGGVYYGMNNAIDKVCGDYVIFMNAGDHFYNSDVIQNIINGIRDERPEVVYGDCMVINLHTEVITPADHTTLSQGMSICHQSILVRSDIIKANKFNTTYKISADYDMMLTLYMRQCSFLKLDLVISVFYANGISSAQIMRTIKEACIIRLNYGIAVNEKKELFNAKKIQILTKIKQSIPKAIWKIWTVNIKKRPWVEE